MSRTRHQRGKSRKYSQHRVKNKEWKGDSGWKKKERSTVKVKPRQERRSPRKRLKK